MDKQKVVEKVIILIAIAAIAFGAYFYYQWKMIKENPQAVAQQEVTDLVAKVGRLVVLPTGETPTIATVSDPEALKDQAFFTSAQKGDKVLIYPTAKRAILYSVSLNKILGIAPLNIGESQKATAPKPAPEVAPETDN